MILTGVIERTNLCHQQHRLIVAVLTLCMVGLLLVLWILAISSQCPVLPHLWHLRLGWRCKAYHPCHDMHHRWAFLARVALAPPVEAAMTSWRGSFPLLPLSRLHCPLLCEQNLLVCGHQCRSPAAFNYPIISLILSVSRSSEILINKAICMYLGGTTRTYLVTTS